MNHPTRIIAAIQAYGGPMPLAALRSAVPDINRATVDQTLSNLVRQGRLARSGIARYVVPASVAPDPAPADEPAAEADDQVGEDPPDDELVPLSYALWHDGELSLMRGDTELVLTADETVTLAIFLAPRAA